MVGPGYCLFWDGILREFVAEWANGIIGLAIHEVRQALCDTIAASADGDDDGC
jgi:hypothetical protein